MAVEVIKEVCSTETENHQHQKERQAAGIRKGTGKKMNELAVQPTRRKWLAEGPQTAKKQHTNQRISPMQRRHAPSLRHASPCQPAPEQRQPWLPGTLRHCPDICPEGRASSPCWRCSPPACHWPWSPGGRPAKIYNIDTTDTTSVSLFPSMQPLKLMQALVGTAGRIML